VADAFFQQYKELQKTYSVTDRQDKYIYPEEYVETQKFGLGLQLVYFRLGNERIIEQSDNPSSSDTQYVLRRNEGTIVHNYNLYLDEVNTEKYYSEAAIKSFVEGIDVYFTKLIQQFPKADYTTMRKKSDLMLKKAQNPEIQNTLTELIGTLDAMKTVEEGKE
jgi:hypothetical protein